MASFKPYYNWNTFNTLKNVCIYNGGTMEVLNLIITGIPSIQMKKDVLMLAAVAGFKPYYNWNTFNTQKKIFMKEYQGEF